jgi:hypothetical protein
MTCLTPPSGEIPARRARSHPAHNGVVRIGQSGLDAWSWRTAGGYAARQRSAAKRQAPRAGTDLGRHRSMRLVEKLGHRPHGLR